MAFEPERRYWQTHLEPIHVVGGVGVALAIIESVVVVVVVVVKR